MKHKALVAILAIIVVALIGYILVTRAHTTLPPSPYYPASSTTPGSPTTSTQPTATSYRDQVIAEFQGLASWKVETLSDWRISDLSRSQLGKYPSGHIVVLGAFFNEYDSTDVENAHTTETALIAATKARLIQNGWQLRAGPTEGGFYHDYLYEKNGKPLILSTGERDAVVGGMYVEVQFQDQNAVPVTLDLSSAYAQQYRGVLTAAFKQPANFDKHYVVASIGCGSGCFGYAVIDKDSGTVYQVPEVNDLGSFVEKGSFGTAYNLQDNEIKVVTANGSTINTYVFNGSRFTLALSEPTTY